MPRFLTPTGSWGALCLSEPEMHYFRHRLENVSGMLSCAIRSNVISVNLQDLEHEIPTNMIIFSLLDLILKARIKLTVRSIPRHVMTVAKLLSSHSEVWNLSRWMKAARYLPIFLRVAVLTSNVDANSSGVWDGYIIYPLSIHYLVIHLLGGSYGLGIILYSLLFWSR